MSNKAYAVRDFVLKYAFVIALIVIFAYFSLTSHGFCTVRTILSMIHNTAPTFIFTAGAALVIIMGMIDLSIGSVMFVAAVVSTTLISRVGTSFAVGILGALAASLVLGLINGVLVAYVKVVPMIATLGTMIAYRGIALTISGGAVTSIPDSMSRLSAIKVGPVYVDILFAFAIVFIVHIIHTRTAFGRHLTAIGNNMTTAEKLGLDIPAIILKTYLFSALLSAVSGILLAIQVGGAANTFGSGKEFTAIAAIVIGGISMSGGEGRVPNIILGVMMLTIIESGLNFRGISPYAYSFFQGAVIFAAMYLHSLRIYVSSKKEMAEAARSA